jgi:hypothetical protein
MHDRPKNKLIQHSIIILMDMNKSIRVPAAHAKLAGYSSTVEESVSMQVLRRSQPHMLTHVRVV